MFGRLSKEEIKQYNDKGFYALKCIGQTFICDATGKKYRYQYGWLPYKEGVGYSMFSYDTKTVALMCAERDFRNITPDHILREATYDRTAQKYV